MAVKPWVLDVSHTHEYAMPAQPLPSRRSRMNGPMGAAVGIAASRCFMSSVLVIVRLLSASQRLVGAAAPAA